MSKQIMKPVWRVNIGDGVPSDVKTYAVVLFGNGSLSSGNSKSEYWNWGAVPEGDIPVMAYETTRTKAAKYERVKCRHCLGVGGIGSHAFCPSCNGKGCKLEAIK